MIRLSQKLQDERLRKGLSIQEVSRALRIRPSFLEAIENGEYSELPSSTYAQGFVRNYAEFLGLPKKEMLALFRREFDEDKVFRVLPEGLTRTKDFPLKRLRLGQTLSIVLAIGVLLFGYILFQYRFAIISPPLEIDSPKEKVVEGDTIAVSGKTDPNAIVSVNNELVSVDSSGSFTKTLDIFPGKTTIIIKASNKFGRETVVQKTVERK